MRILTLPAVFLAAAAVTPTYGQPSLAGIRIGAPLAEEAARVGATCSSTPTIQVQFCRATQDRAGNSFKVGDVLVKAVNAGSSGDAVETIAVSFDRSSFDGVLQALQQEFPGISCAPPPSVSRFSELHCRREGAGLVLRLTKGHESEPSSSASLQTMAYLSHVAQLMPPPPAPTPPAPPAPPMSVKKVAQFQLSFSPGEKALSDSNNAQLRQLVSQVQSWTTLEVVIVVGELAESTPAGIILARSRATVVADALAAAGLPRNRLYVDVRPPQSRGGAELVAVEAIGVGTVPNR